MHSARRGDNAGHCKAAAGQQAGGVRDATGGRAAGWRARAPLRAGWKARQLGGPHLALPTGRLSSCCCASLAGRGLASAGGGVVGLMGAAAAVGAGRLEMACATACCTKLASFLRVAAAGMAGAQP